MRSFLHDLGQEGDRQTVLLVGHGATYWMSKHLLDGVPLAQAITLEPHWRTLFEYTPGSLD